MFERNLNEEMLEEIRLEVLDSLNSSDEYEYEKEEIKENSNILIIESRDPIDTEISKTNPDSTMDTKLEESKISKKSEDNFWAKNNIYDIIESIQINFVICVLWEIYIQFYKRLTNIFFVYQPLLQQ